MKLMKLTLKNADVGSNEIWMNPMHFNGMSIDKAGRTRIFECEYHENMCGAYIVNETPEEVARLFEDATR